MRLDLAYFPSAFYSVPRVLSSEELMMELLLKSLNWTLLFLAQWILSVYVEAPLQPDYQTLTTDMIGHRLRDEKPFVYDYDGSSRILYRDHPFLPYLLTIQRNWLIFHRYCPYRNSVLLLFLFNPIGFSPRIVLRVKTSLIGRFLKTKMARATFRST